MHGDSELCLRESCFSGRVREIPYFGASFLVELRLEHNLLHLRVGQRSALIGVKPNQHDLIILLVLFCQEPDRVLLLGRKLRSSHLHLRWRLLSWLSLDAHLRLWLVKVKGVKIW